MKRYGLSIMVIMVFFIIATGAFAQEQGKTSGWYYCPYCGKYFGPQIDYGKRQGISGGQGMMDSIGYGTVPGMNGDRYDYERRQRIMQQSETCQRFLDETAEMRKELHGKRFTYYEAIRDPKATQEDIEKLERELQELQHKISSKRPPECIW